MRPPSLTAGQLPIYLDALNHHALQRVDFHVLTLDHRLISSIHPIALDGQINFNSDSDKAVSRTLQAGFLDPDHALHIDTAAPTDGMGGLNRLIRVRHSLWVDQLDKWVSVDCFTGQPMVPKRTGDTITLECHDKSARHLRFSPPYTIRKGTPIVTAIRAGLHAAGERHFDFPSATVVKARVARNIPVGGSVEARQPWRVYSRLARSIGYQLIYNGSGGATLRRRLAGSPRVTWRLEGAGANIIGPISAASDHTALRNRAVVTSKRSVGKKKPRTVSHVGSAQLPASNSYSAHQLAAAGEPWINTDYFADNDLETQTQVNNLAKTRLANLTTQQVVISLPVLPVFHLDPLDNCRVETDDASWTFPLREASIPLFDDGSAGMTVGQQRAVRSIRAGRIGRVA